MERRDKELDSCWVIIRQHTPFINANPTHFTLGQICKYLMEEWMLNWISFHIWGKINMKTASVSRECHKENLYSLKTLSTLKPEECWGWSSLPNFSMKVSISLSSCGMQVSAVPAFNSWRTSSGWIEYIGYSYAQFPLYFLAPMTWHSLLTGSALQEQHHHFLAGLCPETWFHWGDGDWSRMVLICFILHFHHCF